MDADAYTALLEDPADAVDGPPDTPSGVIDAMAEVQGATCPFVAAMDAPRSSWNTSRNELAARFRLADDWAKSDKYPDWQCRLVLKELAFAFLAYRVPHHIMTFRLTLAACRLDQRVRLALTADERLLMSFEESDAARQRRVRRALDEKRHRQKHDAQQRHDSGGGNGNAAGSRMNRRFSTNTHTLVAEVGEQKEFAELVVACDNSLNLAKMVACEGVADNVMRGQCCYRALFDLKAIHDRAAAPWPDWLYIPASAGMAAAYSPLFSGAGRSEFLASIVVGGLVAAAEHFAPARVSRGAGMGMELVCAFLAALLAGLVSACIAPINVMNVVLSGIVFHLRGLGITSAIMDIQHGSAHIGAGHLMEVLLISVNLGIGMAGGLHLAATLFHDGAQIEPSMPPTHKNPAWASHLAVLFATVPTTVLFKAVPRHLPQYYLGTAAAYYGTLVATNYMGLGDFSACFGATLVGVLANLYGRYTKFPASEVFIFSIIAIVPGSFALTFSFAGTGESGGGKKSGAAAGQEQAIGLLADMVGIAVAIVAGQFISHVLLPPKRQL